MSKGQIVVTTRSVDTFGKRAAQAIRKVALDVKGQPHTIVEMERRAPDEFEQFIERSKSVHGQQSVEAAPAASSVEKFAAHPRLKDWARIVRQIASEQKLDVDSLWVLVSARPEYKSLTFTTSLGSTLLGWKDPRNYAGKLKVFVRFKLFAKAVIDQEAAEFAVLGNALSYVVDGRRHEIPAEKKVATPYRPVEAPVSGFTPIRGLGLALREAAPFTEIEPSTAGFEQICIRPSKGDAVEVVAASVRAAYVRTIAFRDFRHVTAVRLPKALLGTDQILPEHLNAINGDETLWLHADWGLVVGLENEVTGHDVSNLDEVMSARPARCEFTFDELNAIRRGVSQARMAPLLFRNDVYQTGIRTIALTPKKSALQIRGEKASMQVPCSGAAGPEIFLDEEALGDALRVRGLTGIEYDPADVQKSPVRFSGPQVAVVVMPYAIKE